MSGESNWVEKVQLLGTDGTPLRISSLAEASVVQGLLAANGIDSDVSEPSTAFHELPAHLILVPANQADEAARIVAEARAKRGSASVEAESGGEAAGDLPPDDVNSGSRGLL
jgi:hypothetical protein